ncbi:unnamed protein product [Didymodactylos carnosus]|uniref:Thioredoxin domain-containing protein n=1 Tax=Didymodactylos carnosus TaxID=1234261 RepID=A0A814AUM4_9BILA|nr:unnamed protein product [Didymodactylos carnosus]CAF3697254.1 unnamed protein product [Didymodactylos carnosus]
MAGVAKIVGNDIVDKAGNKVNIAEKSSGKVVGIYFSAHWCPPCRGFTPILAEFYKKHSSDKKLEIIFVSSDRDEKSFQSYYGEQPWLALPYSERDKKQELAQKYQVQGIPTLILLDGDSGDIICEDARSKLEFEDKEGENFPWKNK